MMKTNADAIAENLNRIERGDAAYVEACAARFCGFISEAFVDRFATYAEARTVCGFEAQWSSSETTSPEKQRILLATANNALRRIPINDARAYLPALRARLAVLARDDAWARASEKVGELARLVDALERVSLSKGVA